MFRRREKKALDVRGVHVYPESTVDDVLDDTSRFVEQLSAFAKRASVLRPNKRARVADVKTEVKVENDGNDGLSASDDELDDVEQSLTDKVMTSSPSKSQSQARSDENIASVIHWDEPVFVARAPGRLDVMGGIADYSGSLVLQMPIAEACHVAVQIRGLKEKQSKLGWITVVSLGQGESPTRRVFRGRTSEVFPDTLGAPKALTRDDPSIEHLRDLCKYHDQGIHKWTAYVLGVLQVLQHVMRDPDAESEKTFPGFGPGVSISVFIQSDVPEGAGVSSSAALETAVAYAACAALHEYVPADLKLMYEDSAMQIAKWCQLAENLVAESPCGIMDQMASGLGMEDCLLVLSCRPCELIDRELPIPEDMFFVGIDSGNTHSVGGGDYGRTRTAALMCRAFVAKHLGRENEKNKKGHTPSLTEMLAPSQFEKLTLGWTGEDAYRPLPRIGTGITGGAFLALFPKGHSDEDVTKIHPTTHYDVTLAGRHPVYENERVRTFYATLKLLHKIKEERHSSAVTNTFDFSADNRVMDTLGELMYQSHASYSSLGLGDQGTDTLVEMVGDDKGVSNYLFGAKITGGGSGGTVCVLARKHGGIDGHKKALEAVEEIREAYAAQNEGKKPRLFRGSSPGAAAYGHLKLSF